MAVAVALLPVAVVVLVAVPVVVAAVVPEAVLAVAFFFKGRTLFAVSGFPSWSEF